MECDYEGINFAPYLKPNILKIALYLYYFLRSVVLRGFINTLQLLSGEVKYEKKFGIHTSAIKKSKSKEFFHYQGAGYTVLFRIFSEIYSLTQSCDFIDIGCGKGRAVFVAEYCGYSHLAGIELDAGLLTEAEENSKRYPFKRNTSSITFLYANALDYIYANKPTVYFLFNPFNESVLEKVLDRISEQSSSETWFIYMNPLFPGPFERRGIQLAKKIKTRFYTEALVFRTNAGA